MEKKWIVATIVILVLVVGGLGYLFGSGGLGNGGFNNGSRDGEIGPRNYLRVKGYPVNMPPEVGQEIILGEPVISREANSLGMFGFSVDVKNNSNRVLKQAIFTSTIYGEGGKIIRDTNRKEALLMGLMILNLEPGQTETMHGGPGILGVKVTKFEYTLQDIEWSGTTVLPQEPKPSENGQPAAENVYYAAPKNPTSPTEVTVAFYFLVNEGKYWEAAKHIEIVEAAVEDGKATEAEIATWLEQKIGGFLLPGELEKIRIGCVREFDETFSVHATLYFKNGKEEYTSSSLIKEEGVWKLGEAGFQ